MKKFLASGTVIWFLAWATWAQPCEVVDDGTGTVSLPPEGCEYLSPMDVHMIIDGLPPGTTIELGVSHQQFFCTGGSPNHCGRPGGGLGGELETFDSTLVLQMNGTGDLAGFSRTINLPIACETHTGPRTPGDPVQTFPTDMFQLQGALFGDPDFDFLQITGGTNFGLPSPGQTTLTDLGGGSFNVDSFFDISYQIDFVGAPGSALDGLSGSTQSSIRMQSGVSVPPPNPCTVVDGGGGIVNLPPPGCEYLSPNDVHIIIDGLPPGTTIELDANHRRFFCVGNPDHCGTAGGNLGGETETFNSTLDLQLTGTGDLAGFNRQISVPILCTTHTGPRNPNEPVQTLLTDMFRLEGQIFGDPDFDQLRITGGTDFGLPSPGQITLTRLPDNTFNVDSFFDIDYQIEFVGAPGGALDGLSGTTQASIRMGTGDPARVPQPCQADADGNGHANIPPQGCQYLSPADVHMIIDGLPPGTTIELDPIHQRFICNGNPNDCGTQGGNLGGEVESFSSTLTLVVNGTGEFGNFNRLIEVPVDCITHTGPQDPIAPVQRIPTDMFRVQGEITGDPDFQLLRVTGGTDFGLPSPGQTTLTRLPQGDFVVDSFFDITYQIEFQGAPGSILDGLTGTTQAQIHMNAGNGQPHLFFLENWPNLIDVRPIVTAINGPPGTVGKTMPGK